MARPKGKLSSAQSKAKHSPSFKPECCRDRKEHKIIVLQERNAKVSFANEQGLAVRQVQIDGCQLSSADTTKRCDYLLLCEADGNSKEIFVELKGRDYEVAMQQLAQSIADFGQNPKHRIAYVVTNNCPSNANTKVQTARSKFQKANKARLEFTRPNQKIAL